MFSFAEIQHGRSLKSELRAARVSIKLVSFVCSNVGWSKTFTVEGTRLRHDVGIVVHDYVFIHG